MSQEEGMSAVVPRRAEAMSNEVPQRSFPMSVWDHEVPPEEEEIPMEDKFLDMSPEEIAAAGHEEDFGPEVQIPCVYQSPPKAEEEEEEEEDDNPNFGRLKNYSKLKQEAARANIALRLKHEGKYDQWHAETLKLSDPDINLYRSSLAKVYYTDVRTIIDKYHATNRVRINSRKPATQVEAEKRMKFLQKQAYATYYMAVGLELGVRAADKLNQKLDNLNLAVETSELPHLSTHRSLAKKMLIREFDQDPDQIKFD